MNDYQKFKGRGPFRTEILIVVVLALVVLTLLLVPRFERETEITTEPEIIFIKSVEVPQAILQDMNIPAPKPVIPVPDEFADMPLDSMMFQWDFDTYEGDDSPPPPPGAVSPEDTVIFVPYEKPPTAIGGPAAIARNIVYPDIAREVGIEGKVIIQTYIDESGKVLNCIVWQGLTGTGLNEAAMDAIKKTKFKPAIQRDKPVGVWIAIPVTFKLKK